ncbi:MAG: DUF1361 domain-containing protein [Candidatus Saccharibacteria bacterium]|nr:DUF1361 domain-containing protein [Candidatus Saccharibacteria bacterium]
MKKSVERLRANPARRVVAALVMSHAASVLLLAARTAEAGTPRYHFLLWNMFLAIVPLVFSLWLRSRLKHGSWLAWKNLAITGLWLMFLPNSFYLVTDLIHLHQTYEVNIYYDIVLFTGFIVNGLFTGFMSLYLVHVELAKRVRRWDAHMVMAGVLLLASFAIFLGRFLRWNSWDLFLHPAGVLFDVSNQFIDPASPSALVTTGSFFVMLTTSYAVVWTLASYARAQHAQRDAS